jgi:endoglucanase
MPRTAIPAALSLLLLALAIGAVRGDPEPDLTRPQTATSDATWRLSERLGRGVNLSNMLEAPAGRGAPVTEATLDTAVRLGFDSIRVPIRWSARAEAEPPYRIEPDFIDHVRWVIAEARERGLLVIVNVHHYKELFDDPDGHEDRMTALWTQIASALRDQPDDVLLELLNEPHANLTPERWNALLPRLLDAVRTSNPTRPVLVAPGQWNQIDQLERLRLPDDPNLIVTIHYYEPFRFTHQGASWIKLNTQEWLGTPWNATPEERAAIDEDFDRAAAWGRAHGRPLHLGEFGAIFKADDDSRERWTRYVRQAAEARDIPWTYWGLQANFGVYDRRAGLPVEPIHSALFDDR